MTSGVIVLNPIQSILSDSDGYSVGGIDVPMVIGAQDRTSWEPDPTSYTANTSGPLLRNSDGHLVTRSNVLTDATSFRDDFVDGSLNVTLTGTLNFISGSTDVTGSGTQFMSELNTQYYIRYSIDGYEDYIRVSNILSDTELVLDDIYPGSTASGTGLKTLWGQEVIGADAGVAIIASKLILQSGTSNGNHSAAFRVGDYLPYNVGANISISQRIANQNIIFGLSDNKDDPWLGDHVAYVLFDGVNNTQVKLVSASSLSDQQQTIIQLPSGTTSLQYLDYNLEVLAQKVALTVNGMLLAEHKLHIPGPYNAMDICFHINNSSVVTNTSMTVDVVYFSNFDQVQISQYSKSEPLTFQRGEDIHTITGYKTTTATTANQVILQYTVPASKSFWIVGYTVDNGETTVRGNPVKICKNTFTENTAPGVVDSDIFRAFAMYHGSASESYIAEDFSAMPRQFAKAGDIIYVTVTPTGTGSTVWRASLDFVLKS